MLFAYKILISAVYIFWINKTFDTDSKNNLVSTFFIYFSNS